jgi:hypothetical protein
MKYISSLVCITIVGLSLHIFLQRVIPIHVSELMEGIIVLTPPYPWFVNVLAYVTAIFPVIGLMAIYHLINSHLPSKGRLAKGIVFGLLMLLVQGLLIREPVMNLLVGNGLEVTLLTEISSCLPRFIMCVLIALLMPHENTSSTVADSNFEDSSLETSSNAVRCGACGR